MGISSFFIETEAILTGGSTSKLIPKGNILIEGNRIKALLTPEELRLHPMPSIKKINRSECLALPGFIQTHIHLCQTAMRGIADDLPLLRWLKEKIFPFEASLTEKTIRTSARTGIDELVASGTTCIMDMGSIRHTDVVAQELFDSGMRGYVGKCLMDENASFPTFQESKKSALEEAQTLAQKWHKKDGRIRYAFSPRFVLTCSEELIREAYQMMTDFPESRFHTHASEHPEEVKVVRERFQADNLEYLDRLGVVSPQSCFAHCVQVTAKEIDILSKKQSHVLHCPTANLKLGSGVADIVHLLNKEISVSLGSDGAACSNSLDIWTQMRFASLLQKDKHGAEAMPAAAAFQMATWSGAKALGWETEIGSLESGKLADIVLVDLHKPWMPSEINTQDEYLGALVYGGRPENVTDVMIDGRWVVENRTRQMKPVPLV